MSGPRFKVGDRVVVAETDFPFSPNLQVGERGAIANVCWVNSTSPHLACYAVLMDNGPMRTDFDGIGWSFFDAQLKPEEAAK